MEGTHIWYQIDRWNVYFAMDRPVVQCSALGQQLHPQTLDFP